MAVVSQEIKRRTPFEGGVSFGDVGSYELLEGTAHFSINPLSDVNMPITDVGLAPRDPNGNVQFSSDFTLLCPADPKKGNGALLLDVVNRGNKTILKNFNSTDPNLQPLEQMQSGNGFLMRHGYTLAWCGWQPDLPDAPGLVGMRSAPEALDPDGQSLEGNILGWYQVDVSTDTLRLSHSNHSAHAPVDPEDPAAALYISDHPNDSPALIDRDNWSFTRDSATGSDEWLLNMSSGFQPGRIYQLVYRSAGSVIVGLGMAAVRDIASYLKYSDLGDNPMAGTIDHAYAFGRSQSGRFLRQYVHLGLNEDEAGRTALDGIIAHVAGVMRGEFNLRFGQPSKDICFICPELFPFTDTPQIDPVTGQTASMLAHMEKRGSVPKIMFINTSSEYWRGDAALIHTNLKNMSDAPEHESVRRYHFAGTQHGSGEFPPLERRAGDGIRGQLPFNAVDYNPLLRAALSNLHRWVSTGESSPPSEHPSLDAGSALETSDLAPRFAALPGVQPIERPTHAMRLDYGAESELGRTTTLPPDLGQGFPALVSDVDAAYNEIAGIRLPDLQVPLATYTGWNLRHPENGNPDLIMGVSGGLSGWTLPFAATQKERESSGDPRPSIEERYASKKEYLRLVHEAALSLVEKQHLLEEDVPEILDKATERYDNLTVLK